MADRKLIKKLDTVFSKFIRLRDSQNGYFKCCSCGQLKPIEQADAGHFINRRWLATRWREDNVHAQCRSCNRFSEGDSAGYALFMLNKYGQEKLEYLNNIKNAGFHPKDYEIQALIDEYKEKLKKLSTEKHK